MRLLVIGGSVFVGAGIVSTLLERGHAVTVLNRGKTKDPHGDRVVARLRADRREPGALKRALDNESSPFDAAIDVSAFEGADTEAAIEALAGRTGHFVHVSTGQVYLVLRSCGKPAREDEYPGETVPPPPRPEDQWDYRYGMGKRACEDALVRAGADRAFPATRVRIPIVHGPADNQHRLTAYLARFRDGGPVLLQDGGGRIARHVDARDVAAGVAAIVERRALVGDAVNLAWEEMPSAREVVSELARLSGSAAPIVAVARGALAARGLLPAATPLGGPWASILDPAKAAREIGFVARPWRETLAFVAAAFERGETGTPPGLENRAAEIALARESAPRE